MKRMKEHVEDASKPPLVTLLPGSCPVQPSGCIAACAAGGNLCPALPPQLVFPEGTCVNNEYTVMFKRGAFDLGATVCPIAIKYNKVFVDAFWNSRRQSFSNHLFRCGALRGACLQRTWKGARCSGNVCRKPETGPLQADDVVDGGRRHLLPRATKSAAGRVHDRLRPACAGHDCAKVSCRGQPRPPDPSQRVRFTAARFPPQSGAQDRALGRISEVLPPQPQDRGKPTQGVRGGPVARHGLVAQAACRQEGAVNVTGERHQRQRPTLHAA